MARVAAAVLYVVLAACAACSRQDAIAARSEDFSAAHSQDGPGLAWSRRPSLESALESGMPYGRFRRELLARGWEPMTDAGCRANLAGIAPNGPCAADSSLCRVCEALPELSMYADDGLAVVWFRHLDDGHELRASAVGDIGDSDRVDAGSRFRLVAWEFVDQ